jgi:FtsP/CotA-like multicopper oxidase with cupredoxin domain
VAGARAGDARSRIISLEVRETRWELAPGRTIDALAYNGQVPGPEIRAREGERLRVVVRNALREPTTVHWHGVDVPNAMDGVPGVTQAPIAPGATFTYEFEARPAGTRWFHTHFQEHRQMDLGLVAPLVIEPAAPEPFAADREVTLVLDDWVTGGAPPVPRGGMGGMVMGGGAHAPPYDTMTINGKAYPATPPLLVREGERVRLRLINASAEHTHVVRLAGHRLGVTHTDGNPLEAPVDVDALPIAPSERYDVLVVANRPGAWLLRCTEPGHAAAGEQMVVRYAGHERAEPRAPSGGPIARWEYGLGRGRDGLGAASGAERRYDLVLSGGMGPDAGRWTINGRTYPGTERLAVAMGDRVVVRLRNMSPEAHPMHLHGQSFRVLAVNGVTLEAPIVKDTVDVPAHMGSAVIEFPATNAGDWLFHCHKPMHMEGGMASLVTVASRSGPSRPRA